MAITRLVSSDTLLTEMVRRFPARPFSIVQCDSKVRLPEARGAIPAVGLHPLPRGVPDLKDCCAIVIIIIIISPIVARSMSRSSGSPATKKVPRDVESLAAERVLGKRKAVVIIDENAALVCALNGRCECLVTPQAGKKVARLLNLGRPNEGFVLYRVVVRHDQHQSDNQNLRQRPVTEYIGAGRGQERMLSSKSNQPFVVCWASSGRPGEGFEKFASWACPLVHIGQEVRWHTVSIYQHRFPPLCSRLSFKPDWELFV
ncbi:hypothetical protein N657DRAFT_673897 [Parathielavia appendiculata]|uniref:Uncharacterized protein n=1 Tax=Parathielavia appendiculata TaxID=2587402 RepID=A0AAN6Z1Q0_9PEZI|nr:hypothetical protein N657DRAFT_673897 [Parathielavia appendiculata]